MDVDPGLGLQVLARPPGPGDRAGATAELEQAAAAIDAGRLQEALDRVGRVLAQDAGCVRALVMTGRIELQRGRPAAAISSFERVVAADPRMEHWIWLALCLEMLDQCRAAEQAVARAIEVMPRTATACFAVGMTLDRLGLHDAAAGFHADCVALDDRRADGHHQLARNLQATGRFEAAVEAYRRSIERDERADRHADLASALAHLGRFDEARLAAEAAIRIDPDCAVAHSNLGHALLNLNRSKAALPHYETAVSLQPDHAVARFGQAVALLKSGDFARGWQAYEWRWLACQLPRLDLEVPVWRGEPLCGRTILLHAEQGFGDTLQFVRFAPVVAAQGGLVILEVPPALVRLASAIDGVDSVIACGAPVPPIDLHCPMASLPLALELRLETIPALPYLRVPPEAGRQDDLRRGDGAALVVGLVWAGDPRRSQVSANMIDQRRSARLDMLAPLRSIAGVRFVSFQLGEARAQIASGWPDLADAVDDVHDFADTAARLAGVDLLISVDTAMAHLAGGLGMPVWMLSRFDGCWRWLEGRRDSPWYPSMRIFRQQSPGDWSGAIREVGQALRDVARAARVSSRSGSSDRRSGGNGLRPPRTVSAPARP